MGPHGLLIGATGSGKSELLRTLVLGAGATHSSENLNLVLVDFKGGATFLGLGQLPHTSAVITNLADEVALVDRMQDALHGELIRRQELLRAAGNYASLLRLRAGPRPAAPSSTPMPALFIVVDEFSELLAGKPRVHRAVRDDRPARPQPRRASAAGLASASTRGACTGSSRTCPTGSACARSPRWRAAACSACPTRTSCPTSPGNGYLQAGHHDAGPVQGRLRLRAYRPQRRARPAARRPSGLRAAFGDTGPAGPDEEPDEPEAGRRTDERAATSAGRRAGRAGCAAAARPPTRCGCRRSTSRRRWTSCCRRWSPTRELRPAPVGWPGTAAAGRAGRPHRQAVRAAPGTAGRRPGRRRGHVGVVGAPAERQEHAAAHADRRAGAHPHPARGAVLLPGLRRRHARAAGRAAARRRRWPTGSTGTG